jgi:hypothetical protein
MPTEQETFPTIKQMQIQAKTIMLVMAHITPLQHIMRGTTTPDMDITPTRHHITLATTPGDTDIMREIQDITLAHIHNRQEHRPQMPHHGHLGHLHRTIMQTPPLLHIPLFTTLDTLHSLQQTTMLDLQALMP